MVPTGLLGGLFVKNHGPRILPSWSSPIRLLLPNDTGYQTPRSAGSMHPRYGPLSSMATFHGNTHKVNNYCWWATENPNTAHNLKSQSLDEFCMVLGGQPTPCLFFTTEFAKSNFLPCRSSTTTRSCEASPMGWKGNQV